MKLKSVGFNFLGTKFNVTANKDLADKGTTKPTEVKPTYDLKGVKSLDDLLSKLPPKHSEELRAKISRAEDKFVQTKNIKDLKFAYDFGDKRGPLDIQLEKDVIKFGSIASFPWKPKTRKEKRTEELRVATERNARKKAENMAKTAEAERARKIISSRESDKAAAKSENASSLSSIISGIDEENQQNKTYAIARDTKVFEGSDQYKELQKKLALDRQRREGRGLPNPKEGIQPENLIGINENYKAPQEQQKVDPKRFKFFSDIAGTSPQAQRLRMQREEKDFNENLNIKIARSQKTKKEPRTPKTESERYNISRKQSAPTQEKTLFDESELSKIGTYQTQEQKFKDDADKIKRFRDAAAESRVKDSLRLNERQSNRVKQRSIANENLADNLRSLRSTATAKPVVSETKPQAQATIPIAIAKPVVSELKPQAQAQAAKPIVNLPNTQIPEDNYDPYAKVKKPRKPRKPRSTKKTSNTASYDAQEAEYQRLLAGIAAASRTKKGRFATGGLVPGTGNSDTVPMDLPEGSFVIRKSSVNKIGADNLAKASRFASGGTVPALVMPGEYIYSPQEASKIGSSKLHAMNQFAKFAKGGSVKLARGGTPLSEDNTFDPADPRKMARLAKQLVDQQMQNNPDLTRSQARTKAATSYNDIKTKGQTLVDTSAEANRLKQQLERSTKSLEDQQTVTENLSKGIKGLEAAQKKQEAYLRANPGDARAQKKLDSVNNQLADKRRELVSEKSRLVPLKQTVAADQAQYKTAEDLQSKAKVELDQYKVNKSGEVTLNNKVVGEQSSRGPGSISDIVKQKTAQFETTFGRKATKEDKRNLKQEALGEYRTTVEKQVRAKAQKEGKPVSELQVQSVVDNYVSQASKGQRKLMTNAKGEVTGDTGLGRKLAGGGYKETGELTKVGALKDFGQRALFGSKRTDFEAGTEGDRQFRQEKASGIANRITTAAVGGSLLASGMRAGAPEVSSLAKANEQGVVVEDKAQQEAYRSTLAFAGAIEKAGTYAATTAQAFSALGPVGTIVGGALGGLVGLFKGYADGVKEAEAQIREIKIGAAVSGLQGTFEKLNSGLKTFDDSIADSITANQKIITEGNAGKAFAESGGEKNGFDRLISGITGGGFGGFDVKKFNEINSKNQKEAGASQIVPLTNILNKQAEQLGSSAVKQAGGNAGALDYKDFAASLDAKLTSGGGGFNNAQIQKVASARNVSFDDVKKEIVKVMKDSFKAAQLEKTQKEAVTANQRAINSMSLLSEAVAAAATSVEHFSSKLSTNESLFSGNIGSTKVTGISNQFDQKSTPDFNSFNSAVSKLSDSLGSYGNEFKDQGNAINAASQALPSLLAGAIEDPTGGQDISVQIAAGLREALGAQGIKGAGAERVVSSVAGNVSGQEYTKLLAEAGGDVSKVAEKLLGNIKDPFLNASKEISSKLENASNQYISGLENLAQRQKQIGESFKNLEGAKLQRDKFTAETVATNAGLPSQAGNLISVDRQMQGFRTNQERLTGTKGAEAQDSRVIGDNLKRTQERIRELEPKVQNASGAEGGGAAFRGAASELVKLKSEASNLQESLKNLADQSNNLAILEGKLGQVRQERDNETQRGREFLTADPKERQKILQDRVQGQGLLKQAQAQGGNVSNFSSGQNKALFAFLDSFGPVGKDIADNIVRNTTGLGKKKPEEDMLVGKLAKVYDEQVKANQELIGNQRSLQTDYFSQLTKQNTTFYSNLDKFIAGMEKSQVQDEKNREVAKSAKIKDVKEKTGFLTEAGVTDENLKDVTANKGKISELIKAREAAKEENKRSDDINQSIGKKDFTSSLNESFTNATGANAAKEIGSKGETLNDILSKAGLNTKQSALVREKATTDVSKDSTLSIQEAITSAIRQVSLQTNNDAEKRSSKAEEALGGPDSIGVKIANKAKDQGISAEKFESSLAAVTELNQGIGVKLTAAADTATTNINRLSASISGLAAQQQGIAPVNANVSPAQAIGFAVGGPAFSPRGTDTVPAMLTPGEFVVNRSAAQQNLPLLQSINSGKTSYLAEGGEVLGKRIKASEDVMKIWDTPGLKQEDKIAAIKSNIKNKYDSLEKSSLESVPAAIQGDPRKSAASATLQEVISSLSIGQISKNESVKKVIDSNGGIESLQDFGNIFGDFKRKGDTETSLSYKTKGINDNYEKIKKEMSDEKLLDSAKSYENFKDENRFNYNSLYRKYDPENIRSALNQVIITAGRDPSTGEYIAAGILGAGLVAGGFFAAPLIAPIVAPVGAMGLTTASSTSVVGGSTSVGATGLLSAGLNSLIMSESADEKKRMDVFKLDSAIADPANQDNTHGYAGAVATGQNFKVFADLEKLNSKKEFAKGMKRIEEDFNHVYKYGVSGNVKTPGWWGKTNEEKMNTDLLKETWYYKGSNNGAIDVSSPGRDGQGWPGIQNYSSEKVNALIKPLMDKANSPDPSNAQKIKNYLKRKSISDQAYLIPDNLNDLNQFIVNPEYLKNLNADSTKGIDADIDAKIPQYITQIEQLKKQKVSEVSEKKQDNVVANIANEEGTTPIDTQIRMAENEVLAARGNKQLESKKKSELEILKLRRTSYNQIGLTSNEKLKNAYSQNRPEINENYVNSKAYLTQIKEGTGEKFVATDMGKEDELYLKRQGDAGRLAQIGLRREVQASAILGKMVKLKGIFAKNQGEELNKKEFAEIGKDPNQLIPLGLKEYASLYNGEKGGLAKEDFDNPKLILPFQKEIVGSFFKQQSSSKSLAISGKGLLDFIDQYSNIKDTKGFVEAKVKQAGPDAIPLVVRAIEEGKINALGVLNAAAANVGGISRKSLEGAIGRNKDFNLLDKLSEKQEGKAQKIVRPFSGIDFAEGEDGAYATIKAASGKGQVSMSANNTALRIAAPYLAGSVNNNLGLPLGYSKEQLKQLAGDTPTLGSPSGSLTFAADTPNLFTTEDFLNAISSSKGYATISSKAVVVEEDVEGKKQRKIDYKRNLDIANIENSITRAAMKSVLGIKETNENAPEENKNVVKGEPNEFQAAIIKERDEQKEFAVRNAKNPKATREQKLGDGQYGENSVANLTRMGVITPQQGGVQLVDQMNDRNQAAEIAALEKGDNEGRIRIMQKYQRMRDARAMSVGGVVNYLSSGGVPSHSPNPDPSFFKPKGTDTVPAMLTPGEFVINASATAKHGDLLSAINSGKDVGYSATGGIVYLEDGGQARKKAFYEKMNRQKKYEEESRYLVDDKNKDKYTYMQDRKDDLESTSNRATQTFSRRQNQFLQDEDNSNNDATNIVFDAMGITGLAKAGISAISKFAMKPSLETALHGAKHVGKDYLKEKAQHKGIDLFKSNTEKLLGYASGGLIYAQTGYDPYYNYMNQNYDYMNQISGGGVDQVQNTIYGNTIANQNKKQKNARYLQAEQYQQQQFQLRNQAYQSQQRKSQNPKRQQQPEQWQINWQQQQQASGYKNPYAALRSKPMFPEQRQQQSQNFQDQRAYQANQEMYGGPSAQPAFQSSNYAGSFFNQVPQQQQVAQDPKRKQLSLFGMNLGSYSSGGNVDTIPAMLTPGEFVVNKKASSKNSSLLHAINSGKEVTRFKDGGSVGNISGGETDSVESGVSKLVEKISKVGNNFIQSGRSFQSGADSTNQGSKNILSSSLKFNSGVGNFSNSANKISKASKNNSSPMVRRFSDGGFTPKGTDTVPAMLTPGEFVINAGATAKHGDLLSAINSGKNINYSSNGGLIEYLAYGDSATSYEKRFKDAGITPKTMMEAIKSGDQQQIYEMNLKAGDAQNNSRNEYLSKKFEKILGFNFFEGPDANNKEGKSRIGDTKIYSEKIRTIGSYAKNTKPIQLPKIEKQSEPQSPMGNEEDQMSYASKGGIRRSSSDTIPAMLTPGEFVVNARQSSKNASLLHAINSGEDIQGFANGGTVGYYAKGKTGGGGKTSGLLLQAAITFNNGTSRFDAAISRMNRPDGGSNNNNQINIAKSSFEELSRILKTEIKIGSGPIDKFNNAVTQFGTNSTGFSSSLEKFKTYVDELNTAIGRIPGTLNLQIIGSINASLNVSFDSSSVYTEVTNATESLKGWITSEITRKLNDEMA